MENFESERQYLIDFGFIASQRDAIEWQMYIEELEKDDRKKAKIVVNGKEVKNDKIRINTREVF